MNLRRNKSVARARVPHGLCESGPNFTGRTVKFSHSVSGPNPPGTFPELARKHLAVPVSSNRFLAQCYPPDQELGAGHDEDLHHSLVRGFIDGLR
jgi:hypothetical protein